MDWLLGGLALGPVFAVIFFVYLNDKYDREPVKILLIAFLWGCVSILPALFLEATDYFMGFQYDPDPRFTAIYAFAIVAFSEEVCKFAFLRFYCYDSKSFNEPYDGIIYSVMVGMGFACVENMAYVFRQPGVTEGMGVALFRLISAIPAHASFAIIMGYFVGMAKFNGKKYEVGYLFKGLAAAILCHGLYDFFLMQKITPALAVGALASLSISIWLSFRAIRLHAMASPFRMEEMPSPAVVPPVANELGEAA